MPRTSRYREITTVLRGEEWLPSTPKHELLYHAFGWTKPSWAHLPLLLGPDGSKLSKRRGNATSIVELREQGYLPAALVHSLVLCGWAPAEGEGECAGIPESTSGNADVSSVDAAHQTGLLTLEGLSNNIRPFIDAAGHEQTSAQTAFSLDRVQRGAARLDPVKLDVLNGRFLRAELHSIDSYTSGGAGRVAVAANDALPGERNLVGSAAAARERLLSTLRPVFARAVLERNSNNNDGNRNNVERPTDCSPVAVAFPLAVKKALLQWADSAKKDTADGSRVTQPDNAAKMMHWLLIEGKVDDYLLQVIRLLQKQANGPLHDLAQEHASCFFGHIREQPQFNCKAALASAVIGTMEAMATALEDVDQHTTPENASSSIAAIDMQRILKAALTKWNRTATEPSSKLKQGQFMPQVRMAVTGKGSGADLFPLLSLLGAECVASRLRLGAAALRRQSTTG